MAIRRFINSIRPPVTSEPVSTEPEGQRVLEQEAAVPAEQTEIIEKFGEKDKRRHIEVIQRLEEMFSAGGKDYDRVLLFYRYLFTQYKDLGLEMPNILDGDPNHRIVYEPESDMVPRIQIKDFDLFNIYLAQLSRSMDDHQLLPWADSDLMYSIWTNATYEDFSSPERFVRRMSEHIEDETFAELDTNRVVALESIDQHTIHVQRTTNSSAYEAPYDLTMGLTVQGVGQPSEENMLPSVRYGVEQITGFSPEKRAYIYAIQDPPVDGTTEGLMKSSRETERIKAAKFLQECKVWSTFYPQLMGEVFGEDIVAMLGSEELDAEEMIVLLSKRYLNRGTEGKVFGEESKETEGIDDMTVSKIMDTVQKIGKTGRSLKRYREVSETFKKRRGNNAILKEAFGGGIPNSKKELRNVPPTRIVSMCAALTMLHSKGIREVKIPIFLPLRYEHKREQMRKISIRNSGQQVVERTYEEMESAAELAKDEADDLYENISSSLIRLAERVAFEMDGVEIVGLPDDTSYITLRLENKDRETGEEIPLSSKRPLLQEIIEKMSEL